MACYYHIPAVVKCLIEQRGCNVNAQTPFENDGRTALNMYSNNQLAYADNDILDLLHSAGADLELGSASKGRGRYIMPLETIMYGLRRRLLELGATLEC